MNAPELPKQYVAYPPPKFHTTLNQPTQVPVLFNPKEWTRRPTPKTKK